MRPLCKISLFALALIFLSGCGSNKENEDPQPENDLVGTWTSVSQTSKAMVGTMTYAQALMGTIFGDDPAWAAQMETIAIQANNMQHTMYFPEIKIENGGKFIASSGSANAAGNWTLSSDEKVIKLTLDGGSREMTGTVTKLTDTDLWIEVKLNQSDPLGFLPTYTYSSLMKYSRKK